MVQRDASAWSADVQSADVHLREVSMAKPHRGLKKANHGARPANSKARTAKRKHIRT